MAWRDSRRSRGRLLVFSTALSLGVAALVAIGSVGWNLQRAINDQARSLVGADLVIEGRHAPDDDTTRFISSLGATELAYETRLASMANFPKGNGARLTQVRAIEGNYPFYGGLETDPPDAVLAFKRGEGAIVEPSLLLQYGQNIGDTIRIGGVNLPILGTVTKLPGEANTFASIAPRVLISRAKLSPTLTARGSLVRYLTYLRLPPGVHAPDLAAAHREEFKRRRVGNLIAVACGGEGDASVLKHLTETVLVMKDTSPDAFSQFFKWVSASVTQTSQKVGTAPGAAASGVALPPPPPTITIIP